MDNLLIVVHIVVCFFLVAIVLLQHGKGADIGATFGGSSQTLFGTEGPLPLLNKVTTSAAIIFMLTSVVLAYQSSQRSHFSVMTGTQVEQTVAAPAESEKNVKEAEKPAQKSFQDVAPLEIVPAEATPPATTGDEQKAPLVKPAEE